MNKGIISRKEAEKLKDDLKVLYKDNYTNIMINCFNGYCDSGLKMNFFSITLLHYEEKEKELLSELEKYGYVYRFDFNSEELKVIRVNEKNIFYNKEEFDYGSFSQYFISKEYYGENFILLNGDEVEYK